MNKTMRLCLSIVTLALLFSRLPPPVSAQTSKDQEVQARASTPATDALRRLPPSSDASTMAPAPAPTSMPPPEQTADPISRIRDEGLNRSQVIQTLSYLTDVIGPRLTASANLKRANEWTRDKLASWGLTNAHLEAWGPFGRGWSLKRFSAQIVEPQAIPLVGYPNAWSPGIGHPIEAEVVYLGGTTDSDLEKHKGKLKGAVILTSPVREVRAHFEPLARRLAETNLLQLANAGLPRTAGGPFTRPGATGGGVRPIPMPGRRGTPVRGRADDAASAANALRSGVGPDNRGGVGARPQTPAQLLAFAAREGAALVVYPSVQGDEGTFFVSAASVPVSDGQGTNAPADPRRPGERLAAVTERPGPTRRLPAWATNAPAVPPQITVEIEDYNRMVRMIQQGEKLKMAVDLEVQFHNDDPMAYNTIAEIPGRDLKNEIVMLGGHLDSWHAGTGATDDAAGVAAAMEAVRIIEALKLKPRRTIRIGLWSGEEQGLLGSRAYVSEHFGYYTNLPRTTLLQAPKDPGDAPPPSGKAGPNPGLTRRLIRRQEYEKFSVYFNLDNGGGRIRGVYMQGNEAVRPIFRRWLEPFSDLDAETLTPANTGGTDHQSFDGIGLPAFQFIQDPIDYMSRTHHSNEDVFDRIQPDDLKQAATILAGFVYDAAMADTKLPRKPTD